MLICICKNNPPNVSSLRRSGLRTISLEWSDCCQFHHIRRQLCEAKMRQSDHVRILHQQNHTTLRYSTYWLSHCAVRFNSFSWIPCPLFSFNSLWASFTQSPCLPFVEKVVSFLAMFSATGLSLVLLVCCLAGEAKAEQDPGEWTDIDKKYI